MKKINAILIMFIMTFAFYGCTDKPKVMTEYGIGKTYSSRSLDDPQRTQVSTDQGEDVFVMGYHDVPIGYNNDDKYLCVYDEANCWKTVDSNGSSPSNRPNKYKGGKKE